MSDKPDMIEPMNEVVVKVKDGLNHYYMLFNPFIGWFIFSMDQDWNEDLPFSSLLN